MQLLRAGQQYVVAARAGGAASAARGASEWPILTAWDHVPLLLQISKGAGHPGPIT